VDLSLRAVLVNLLVAIGLRSRLATDGVHRLAVGLGRRGPRILRRLTAGAAGYGGLHVGAAGSAALWFAVLNNSMLGTTTYPTVCLVVNAGLSVFFVVTPMSALSPVRRRVRELFRVVHRFGVWFIVGLLWVQTELVLSMRQPGVPWHQRFGTEPEFWLLLAMTTLLLVPWLRLRRVPIEVRRSRDVVVVRLEVGRPPRPGAMAMAMAMASLSPFGTCHQFTQVVEPGRRGATLVMPRRRGWVNDLVDFPRSHLWVHAAPTFSPVRLGDLHSSAMLVVTGTAITEALARLARGDTATALLWVVRDPVRSYGEAFVDRVRQLAPDALIVDTAAGQEPDLTELALFLHLRSDADAVGVVGSRRAVSAIRRTFAARGVPTFGP
jgi:hypothetical protein